MYMFVYVCICINCILVVLSYVGGNKESIYLSICIRPPPDEDSLIQHYLHSNCLAYVVRTGTWLWVGEWSMSLCLSHKPCSPG